MTLAQMRATSSAPIPTPSRWKSLLLHTHRLLVQNESRSSLLPVAVRSLAQVRQEPLSELWFTASFPAKGTVSQKHLTDSTTSTNTNAGAKRKDFAKGDDRVLKIDPIIAEATGGGPEHDHRPPNERTLKLGKTLRTLSPLLPNILSTTLPPEILSPNISLHLFPSTHPHLPVVKGRVPYRAALWTAPVAWGCVPILGNVKLRILSEKIVRSGFITAPTPAEEESDGIGEEKLVVRWKTEEKANGSDSKDKGSTNTTNTASKSSAVENGGINRGLSTLLGGDRPLFSKDAGSDTFSGLFIFSFDSSGRIVSQTIEHTDENDSFDKTSRVITLTDWLLGKAKWRALREQESMPVPGLAYKMRAIRDEIRKDGRWQRRY